MSEQNFNQSMKPFCGNSNATGIFMEANYRGGDLTKALNSETNPEIIIGQPVEGIMLAQNYRQNAKVNGMQDTDIHNQYIDFIVRTALFHREFDTPTTLGSNLEGLRSAFENTTNEMFDRKIDMAINIKNPVIFGRNNIDILISNYVNMSTNTFLEYINAFLILSNPQMILNDRVYISNLTGKCKSRDGYLQNLQNKFGDMCMAAWFTSDGGNQQSSAKYIRNFLETHNVDLTYFDTALNDFDLKIKDVIIQYYNLISNENNLNALSSNDIANTNNIKRLIADVTKKHRTQLHKMLSDSLYGIAKPLMNTIANFKFVRISDNQHARDFYENVILKWQELNSQARDFYRHHIALYRKVGASNGVHESQSGWNDISAKLDADFQFVKNLSRDELRLNLIKEHAGAEKVLFGTNLPFIPVNKVKRLWYTNSTGLVSSVNMPESDSIRKIYHCVYMGVPCIVGGVQLNLPIQYRNVVSNINDFDIDDAWVIRNIIFARKVTNQRQVNPTSDNLLVQDMVTKVVYHRDANGLYRIDVNGQRIPYDKDRSIRADNCGGTMLKGNGQQCSNFVRNCLLNGDSNGLNNCLAALSDQNMFSLVEKEFEGIDPEVAVEILKTFKFKKISKTDRQYVESQSFDSWKETVLNSGEIADNVRQAILGNPKLCDYLKGVVAFVNASPALLNPGWKGDTPMPESDDPYIRALRKTTWVNPRPEDMKYAESRMLLNTFSSPMMGITVPGRLINPFVNTVIGNGALYVPTRNMNGGGNSYEDALSAKINANGRISENMELMFADVHDDLKKAGYVLSDSDHFKLQNSFKELAKTENRLSDLHGMLRTLADLHSLFKASGCVSNDYVGNVSIENLKNRQDTLAYLKQNIDDIQNCINNNITNQNSKCAELSKYYSALVDASVGKVNDNVVRVSDI